MDNIRYPSPALFDLSYNYILGDTMKFLLLLFPFFLFAQETDTLIVGYQLTIYDHTGQPDIIDATFKNGDVMKLEWDGAQPDIVKTGWLNGSLIQNIVIPLASVSWSGNATATQEITLNPGYYQLRIRKIGDQNYYGASYLSDYSNRQDIEIQATKPATILFKVGVN